MHWSDEITVRFPVERRTHALHLIFRRITKHQIHIERMGEAYPAGPAYHPDEWGQGHLRKAEALVPLLYGTESDDLTLNRGQMKLLANILREGELILAEPATKGGEREPINLTDLADMLRRRMNLPA
jgi:hypothetical protein